MQNSVFVTYESDGSVLTVHPGRPFRYERCLSFLDDLGFISGDLNEMDRHTHAFAILEGCVKDAIWSDKHATLNEYWQNRSALSLAERFELFDITTTLDDVTFIYTMRAATLDKGSEVETDSPDEKKSVSSNTSTNSDEAE